MRALGSISIAAPVPATERRQARFVVETVSTWDAIGDVWEGAFTPFQDPIWIESLYHSFRTKPGLTPLLVTARDQDTGEVALRLPLVLLRQGRMRMIAFADFDLTDYNGPLLGTAAPSDAATMRRLWREILGALPAADVIRLAKMPVTLGNLINPFALLPRAVPSAVNGNVVETGDHWDLWRRSLDKTVRKELERSWRVFERHATARFEIVTNREEAHRCIATMEIQQAARMEALGADYTLDDPNVATFYRRIVDEGLASGYAIVTALIVGDDIIASLLGIRQGRSYVMIRICNVGGTWTNCSPGRLVIERTMAALHADGCRSFDFSIGNYDYKRRFNVSSVPLVNVTSPLSLRGMTAFWRAQLAGHLRRFPNLDRVLRGIKRHFNLGKDQRNSLKSATS